MQSGYWKIDLRCKRGDIVRLRAKTSDFKDWVQKKKRDKFDTECKIRDVANLRTKPSSFLPINAKTDAKLIPNVKYGILLAL